MNYDKDQLIAELNEIDIFNDERDLNSENSDWIWNIICSNTIFNDNNAHYGSGASKFVIIPDDADYVIKIPFMALNDEDYEGYYCKEKHEWIYEDDYISLLNFEYCEVELNNYLLAKNEYEGAELFLAKTKRIFTGNTINGYVQEKVVNFYDWCKKENINDYGYDLDSYSKVEKSYKSYDKSSSITTVIDNYGDIPAIWFDQLYKYAEKNDKMTEVEQFFQFLIDTDINDLCARNIGFIGDKPVLMDYSGWDS